MATPVRMLKFPGTFSGAYISVLRNLPIPQKVEDKAQGDHITLKTKTHLGLQERASELDEAGKQAELKVHRDEPLLRLQVERGT
jgi:hypothetical protein